MDKKAINFKQICQMIMNKTNLVTSNIEVNFILSTVIKIQDTKYMRSITIVVSLPEFDLCEWRH
jgi:hypothetical protein